MKFDKDFNLNKLIRRLAKTNYYQTIFTQEKFLGITFFKNKRDLTSVQLRFLQDLSFYSALYLDYQLGEVSDIVFEDDIYEDAYIYYRNKHQKKRGKEQNKLDIQQGKPSLKPTKEKFSISEWVFKKPSEKGEF